MKPFLLLLLLPVRLLAQDLTGVWTGSLQSNGSTMPYELVISGSKDKLGGYAMTVFTFNGTENVGVKTVLLKSKKGILSLEDNELVYHNYTTPPKRQKLLGSLTLELRGTKMFLSGTFVTRSLDFRSRESYSGTIRLQKQSNPGSSQLMAKLEEMRLTEALSFMPSRPPAKEAAPTATVAAVKPAAREEEKTTGGPPAAPAPDLSVVPANIPAPAATQTVEPEAPPFPLKKRQETVASVPMAERRPASAGWSQKTAGAGPSPALTAARAVKLPAADLIYRRSEIVSQVPVVSDSLVLTLYDNGEVDGDTVSVVLNNQVIIARKGLTAAPLRTTIYLTPEMGDSVQLTLYAENLGRIAPNTGLLVVQDGANRHDIRFSGDFQKNAAIVLRRKR